MDKIEILKEFMKENNLNQAGLGRIIKKDAAIISKYLSGERDIPDLLISSLDDYDSINKTINIEIDNEKNIVKRIMKKHSLSLEDISTKIGVASNTLKNIAYSKNHKLSEPHRILLENLEKELNDSLENNLLKKVLSTFNIKQIDLSDLLDVSPSAISGWNDKMPKMAKYALELMLENRELKSGGSKMSIGDTVVLKSNENISMSIVEIKEDKATCIWFDKDKKLQKENICIQTLKKSS